MKIIVVIIITVVIINKNDLAEDLSWEDTGHKLLFARGESNGRRAALVSKLEIIIIIVLELIGSSTPAKLSGQVFIS